MSCRMSMLFLCFMKLTRDGWAQTHLYSQDYDPDPHIVQIARVTATVAIVTGSLTGCLFPADGGRALHTSQPKAQFRAR